LPDSPRKPEPRTEEAQPQESLQPYIFQRYVTIYDYARYSPHHDIIRSNHTMISGQYHWYYFSGRNVKAMRCSMIGRWKTQSYQWFAGNRQAVFTY